VTLAAALTVPRAPTAAVIPGGDEAVALLEGDYRGRKADSRFTRADACVSGRWDRTAPVFPTGS
jgi:hypothetical protein